MGRTPAIRDFSAIDWNAWTPVDRCTLVFVFDGERVLLIRKKRGLGAGKVNGPGGRQEPGESIEQCGIRETREEVGLVVSGLSLAGVLRFQFADGYATHVHVFRTDTFEGSPIETDEALPFWTPVDAIPYDEMWADDRLWIPMMLEGKAFEGRFLFDGDRLVDYVLEPAAGR